MKYPRGEKSCQAKNQIFWDYSGYRGELQMEIHRENGFLLRRWKVVTAFQVKPHDACDFVC